VNSQKVEKTTDTSEDKLRRFANDEQVTGLEEIMNNYFQQNNLNDCAKEKFKNNEPLRIDQMNQHQFIQENMNKYILTSKSTTINELETNPEISKEESINLKKQKKKIKNTIGKKKTKILNEIEQILLKSIPSSNNQTSLISDEMIAARQIEYKTCVSVIRQQLQLEEDENLILNIKSCLEKKNILMTNADPKYQYESMLLHIGVIDYARDAENMINDAKSINLEGVFKTRYTDFVTDQNELYLKHEKIFNDMLESMEDGKIKIKIKCFKESQCLFESHKYKYENYLRTIGIILYGFGNTLEEEESIESEMQVLKTENIVNKSVKSKNHKKKHKVENETNIEQLEKKTTKTSYQNELQITNHKQFDQSRDNKNEKIVINDDAEMEKIVINDDAEKEKITKNKSCLTHKCIIESETNLRLEKFIRELYLKKLNEDID
jgi:hypothetical protein